MVKFNLNSDHSLIGTLNKDKTITIQSTHKNSRNSKRLVNNINDIISLKEELHYSLISLKDTPYILIDTKTNQVTNLNELTSFETRIFARETSPEILPFSRFELGKKPPKLKTDLHTHFAATLTPEKLMACGIGKNVTYPKWLAIKLKLNTKNLETKNNGYLLEDLLTHPENKPIILNSMKIDTSEQETFNNMEEIYAARGPFTKNPNMFLTILEETARDAKANGIEYMELSLSSILSNMSQLKIVEKNLPRIEKETGVKLRFLGALYRHSDKEWNEDEVQKLKISARSPYIVGCDFMGHETNPTKDFYEELKELAKYAITNDPNFVIRVHAGENVIFKSNVRQALLAIEDAHRELESQTGKSLPYPQVRIGHGIYGFDQAPDWDEPEWSKQINTMELCKKISPIIEFNMSSNLSLNNINNLTEIPIKDYIDNGIKVVLGTDGRGIYSTTISQEMILAKEAGLTPEDFAKIRKTEQSVISKETERFKNLQANLRNFSDEIRVEQDKIIPHFTKEVEEKYKAELISCQERLKNMIEQSGAETNSEEIVKATNGKRPILITGSSYSHFPKIEAHPEQIKKIGVVFDVLLKTIDPKKAYFMTGGTNHGVEKMFHERANNHNENNPNQKFVILGTLTEEAAKNSHSQDEKLRNSNKIEKHTITHAITPILNGKIAKRWFDLPDTVLDMVQQSKGTMIAIGGGSIVGDMITRAHNLGLKLNIMDGIEGASSNKSDVLNGNNYSFETAKELIHKILIENSSLIKSDLTPEKLDAIIKDAFAKENAQNNEMS